MLAVWMWNPAQAMVDLELKRTPGDRRLHALEGSGTLRLEGFVLLSRVAAALAIGAFVDLHEGIARTIGATRSGPRGR